MRRIRINSLPWKIAIILISFIITIDFLIVITEPNKAANSAAVKADELARHISYFLPEETQRPALLIGIDDFSRSIQRREIQKIPAPCGVNCSGNALFFSQFKTSLYIDPISIGDTILLKLRI